MKIISYRQNISGIDIATQKAILWPCLAFNVTVPIQKEKDLNIFEETVLKMIDVETNETEKLSKLLSLKPQLIEFIKSRLVELNLITDRFELTADGLELIEHFDKEENEYEVVTLFVNMVSGELFPVVVENLEFIRDYNINGNQVTFNIGTSGNPIEIRAKKIRYSFEHQNKVLSSEDVIKTVNAFRKLYNRFSSVIGSKIKLPKFAKNMGRLTINQKAEEIYMSCKVIIPKGNSDFLVTDPFGFDFSTQLTKDIQNEDNDGFLKSLRNRAESLIIEENNQKTDNEDNEWYKGLFSIEILNRYRTLKRHLQKVEDNYLKSKEKVNNSDDEKRIKDNQSRMIESLYAVMESVLKQTDKDYPSDISYKEIFASQSSKVNQQMLEKFAIKVGFTIPKDKSFLHLQPNTVNSLNNGIVRPELMVALALSRANENLNHPFYTLAKNVPYFFDFMKKLQEYRNSVSHGSELDISIFKVVSYRCNKCSIELTNDVESKTCEDCSEPLDEIVQFDKLREIAYLSLQSLYPEIGLADKKEYKGFSAKIVLPNQDILKAKKGLDRNFSLMLINEFKDDPELYDQLIKIEKAEMDIDKKANVYVNSMYSTLQIVLDKYNQNLQKNLELDSIRGIALKNAKKVNFELDSGGLTKELASVGRNKIRDVVQGKPASLGASSILFLASETEEKLKELQTKIPDFIMIVSLVLSLRGHGDRSSESILEEIKDKSKLYDLKKSVYETIKKIKEN